MYCMFCSFKFQISRSTPIGFSTIIRHLSQLTSRINYSSPEADQPINKKPNWVPFYKAKYGNHVLEPPVLENQFTGNAYFQNFIKNQLPQEVRIIVIVLIYYFV